MDIEVLIKDILDCALAVRKSLAPGYMEKVYENAMMIELAKVGIKANQQVAIKVQYEGQVVGNYIADILVADCVILEIKAVKDINDTHQVQLVNYLTATGIDNGLIINFGNNEKIQIKRKYRVYKTTK